jgi:hypothetical protein
MVFGFFQNARDHTALFGHAHSAFGAKLLKGLGYVGHGCLQ